MVFLSVDGTLEGLRVAVVFYVLGAALCIIYDFIRLFRAIAIKNIALVILLDIAFSVSSALLLYSAFIAFNNGMVRFYLLLCAFVGFATWRLTLSRLLFPRISRAFARMFDSLSRILKRFFSLLARSIRYIWQILSSIISKLSNIFGKDDKKDLQHHKV